MGVVADIADRVIVMQRGEIVEAGTVEQVFKAPDATVHPAAAGCRAAPRRDRLQRVRGRSRAGAGQPSSRRRRDRRLVVDLHDVAIEYPKRGRAPAFRAVDGVTLTVGTGEVVGLVGESGSGKTTIGRAIVGLLPFVEGEATVLGTNMVGISKDDLRKVRRDVSFVFQDPGSSLNPRLPIGESIGEPLLLQKVAKGAELSKRVEACSTASTSPATCATATPTSCRAGSASASASPGPSRSIRSC